MAKKCCWLLWVFRNFFNTNLGSGYNQMFKKLARGLIITNGILLLYDIFYLSYLKISFLSISMLVGLAFNVISCILNNLNRTKIAFYIIIILNLLFFPINTLLFSIDEAFYFISVLGGIILAVHLPRLYEFVAAAVIGVILFFIERSYFTGFINPDKILNSNPALFYIRTALMFCIYTYWLYLYKRNHYLHSKIIANKDLTLLKYMTALNQSAAVVVITDDQGNIEYVNPQTEISTGYQIDEILGKNPRIFQSGKTSNQSYEQIWEQLQSGESWKGTLYSRRKNNEEYIEQAIITPVKDQNNEVVNYVAIKEDVTEHLKMLFELQESNAKYYQLTEQTTDLILIINIKTLDVLYVNVAVNKILGYLPEEIINYPLNKTVTEESYIRLMHHLKTHMELHHSGQRNIFRDRYKMIKKYKQIVDVEVSAFFIVDHLGNPIEIHAVVRDITEQLKKERELDQTNRHLKQSLNQTTEEYKTLLYQITHVFNNTTNAISFFEVKEQEIYFTSCNERWANNIGYNPEELVGKNIANILDDETLGLYRKYINKAIDNQLSINEEIYWRQKYLYLNIFSMQEKDGKKYFLCFIYDITDKKKVEERLLETEQRFINIFKISKDSIVVLSPELKIVQANESFYKTIKITNGKKIDSLVNIVSYKNLGALYNNIDKLNSGSAYCQFESELLSVKGDTIPVEMNLSLIKDSQQPLILCVIRDVSIRKNFEKKLVSSGIKIESLERQKLANDLHDNVGPLLSSLNMCLSLLFRKPEVKKYSDDINDINKMLKDSICAVREISNNLSPRVLNNYGLVSALETFFETKQKLVNIKFIQNIDSLRFDKIKEAMLYNILKEVFNNTLKYSQTTDVKLKITRRFDYIVVKYVDYGIGFDFDEKLTPANNNLGLFSLINRLKMLEGEYRIKTAPGEGFLLNLMFPVN